MRITLAIGRPVLVCALDERAQGDRQLLMDCIGIAIAKLLPSEYRGVYGEGVAGDERARRLYQQVLG